MPTLTEIRREAAASKLAPLFGGSPAFVQPITPERALYNEILVKYQDAPGELSIMPGDIVSEVVLSVAAASQVLVWNIRTDQPNPTNAIRSTEIRLETRDSFVADKLTVMFGNELIASIAPGTTIFQQWPNPALVAVGGLDANAPGVNEAYNGQLAVIVNSVQYMRKLAMQRMQYADQMQRGTLTFTASNTAFNTFAGDRGFVPLTPCMDIKGTDSTQFTTQLPEPFNFGAVALNRVVGRLILRGMLIQGGAEYVR